MDTEFLFSDMFQAFKQLRHDYYLLAGCYCEVKHIQLF
jgi:hypothetical protein